GHQDSILDAVRVILTSDANAVLEEMSSNFGKQRSKRALLAFERNLYCYYEAHIYNILSSNYDGPTAYERMTEAGFQKDVFMEDIRRGENVKLMVEAFGPVSLVAVEVFKSSMLKSASFIDYVNYCKQAEVLVANLKVVDVTPIRVMFEDVLHHIENIFK
ncbi:hypothetical protein, partial, partial [Parasitella parasitica]